ncbi:MAG: helix-turn-helix domain-containing protein [Paludibacteraceae bacterium]
MDNFTEIGIGRLHLLREKHLHICNYEDCLEIIRLDGSKLNKGIIPPTGLPLKINAISIIITIAGTAHIALDTAEYDLGANTLIDLIGFRTLRQFAFSDTFRGYHLLVKREFYDEVFQTGKHLTPEAAVHKTHFPIDHISQRECRLLCGHIENLIATIGRKEHIWYRRMVENTLKIFFMEIGNIIIRAIPIREDDNPSGYALIFTRFMQLLHNTNGQRQTVAFYADKLCISPDYLAQAVKTYSHQTVSYWINDTLVQEAKNHLANRNLSIQQIADRMDFADQSSFGRFFKKNTGKSPAAYRAIVLAAP